MMDCSVIVPVYNGADAIAACAESLISQETQYTCEFLFVDNGSTDATVSILEEIARRDARVQVLHEAQRGSYAARNRGVASARGKYLLFTDTDCVAQPGWIDAFVSVFADEGAAAVLGQSLGDETTAVSRTVQSIYAGIWKQMLDSGEIKRLDTRNCAIRSDVLKQVGLFRADFKNLGDAEMGYRIRKHGYRLHYAANALIVHTHIQTFDEMVSKAQGLGRNLRQQFASMSDAQVEESLPGYTSGKAWRLSRHAPSWLVAIATPVLSLALRLYEQKWQAEVAKRPPSEQKLESILNTSSSIARILGFWHTS